MARRSKGEIAQLNQSFVYSCVVSSDDIEQLKSGLKQLAKSDPAAIDCLEFLDVGSEDKARHLPFLADLICVYKLALSKTKELPRKSDFEQIVKDFLNATISSPAQATVLLAKFPIIIRSSLKCRYKLEGKSNSAFIAEVAKDHSLFRKRFKSIKYQQKKTFDLLFDSGERHSNLPGLLSGLERVYEQYKNFLEPDKYVWVQDAQKLYIYFKKLFLKRDQAITEKVVFTLNIQDLTATP